jgi:hypothetical protein
METPLLHLNPEERLTALAHIYLELNLPLHAAVQAAQADATSMLQDPRAQELKGSIEVASQFISSSCSCPVMETFDHVSA